MSCSGDCTCCHGACCKDGECSILSCSDCAAIGGLWQGPASQCQEGACPCDPPADHNNCESCQDGTVTSKCEEGQVCCPAGTFISTSSCCVGQCAECCSDIDCPPEHICVSGVCTRVDLCENDDDCIDTECCVGGYCDPVSCPTADFSATWCFAGWAINAYEAEFSQYYGGIDGTDDCEDAGPPVVRTRYWMVHGDNPDEIQQPGGAYTYPVPGQSAPTGKTCRYVWRVWVGFGPQDIDYPNLAQPTKCEGKMYYMWIDVNRCAPTGGPVNVTEDTGYDWGSWPTGCAEGCADDANPCMDQLPSGSVNFAP